MPTHRFVAVAGTTLATLVLVVAAPGRGALASPAGGRFVPCDAAALVQAIDDANAMPASPTTLDLTPRCTYRLPAADNESDFGPNGLPVVVSRNLTIHGHGAVITRRAGAPPFRILEIGGEPAAGNLTLDEATISNGDGSDGNAAGGVLNSGTLTVTDSRIADNFMDAGTGTAVGVGVTSAAGATLALDGVTVTGNTGRGEFVDGGGVHSDGAATIRRSVITRNRATSRLLAVGGGLSNNGTMELSGSRVSDNDLRSDESDGLGGGIGNVNGRLTVAGSPVSDNTASGLSGASGGGIFNGNGLTVRSSSIDGNTAAGRAATAQVGGGGILSSGVNGAARATLVRTDVDGNTARCSGGDCVAIGGGLYSAGKVLDLVVRDDSSVSRNSATADGGGQAIGGGLFNGALALLAGRTSVGKNTVTARGAGGRAFAGGIWNDGRLFLERFSAVTKNTVRAPAPAGTADGGGIYNDAAPDDVRIGATSEVDKNKPNNCAGPGTPIDRCTG